MESISEKLIEVVKSYPILYDLSHNDYKNIRKKDKIWNAIAFQLSEESGDVLKCKWKNLRDSYMKHLKSQKTKTGQACTKTKSWVWAKPMEYFRPFLKFAETKSNITQDSYNYSDPLAFETVNTTPPDTNDDSFSNSKSNDEPAPRKRRVKQPDIGQSSGVDKVITYLNNKQRNCDNSTNYDTTEHMFLGFAKTLKTFSPKRQAQTKMKIAQIVLEEELLQREEDEDGQIYGSNISSSFSHSPLNSSIAFDVVETNNMETATQYFVNEN